MRDLTVFASLLRQGLRSFARRPYSSLVAVLAVAVAVAAITSAFVLVHAALLAPLPFADPERLVTPDAVSTRGFGISISVPNYRDWSTRTHSFASTAAETDWQMVLSGRGPARVLHVEETYGSFFSTLGLVPRLGRAFEAKETENGAVPQVVLGDSFYRELGGDPGLLGTPIVLDGRSYTVIGVLPPGVGYPSPDVPAYVPLGALGDRLPWQDRESSFGLRMLARLRPGVTTGAAQRDLEQVWKDVERETGHPIASPHLRSLADLLVGDLRRPLLLLFAAAALVVLLAIANVANLFLVRGEARRGELALRSALGAGRGELVRLQLAESACVSALGALAGTAIAAALIAALSAWIAPRVPFFVAERLGLGVNAVAFGIAVSSLVALAVGVLPAWALPKGRAAEALASGRTSASPAATRLRAALVAGELALGTVLLIGAGLLSQTADRLRHVDKGFDSDGVVAGRLAAPRGHFADREQWLAFYRNLLERAQNVPGARSAAISLLLPLSERSWEFRVFPEGVAITPDEGDSVLYNIVSPRYFETFGVPLLRGRLFGPQDRNGTELVAIVDETLAARFWPGADPIGRRVNIETVKDAATGAMKPVYRTIVGVAKNVRHYELEHASRIQIYVPLEQTLNRWGMSLELAMKADGRTSAALAQLLPELPKAVASVDAGVPIDEVFPLAANLDRALSRPTLLSTTVSALGMLALLLAAIGVYALAAHSVAERQREFGIRQSVGATPAIILRHVLGRAASWWAFGTAAGSAAAALLASLATSLLFESAPVEPRVYVAVAAVLLVATLGACAAPAIKALRVDPARILREQS